MTDEEKAAAIRGFTDGFEYGNKVNPYTERNLQDAWAVGIASGVDLSWWWNRREQRVDSSAAYVDEYTPEPGSGPVKLKTTRRKL